MDNETPQTVQTVEALRRHRTTRTLPEAVHDGDSEGIGDMAERSWAADRAARAEATAANWQGGFSQRTKYIVA